MNINDSVRVKLTDIGIGILRQRHEVIRSQIPNHGKFEPPVTDDHGWATFQLWDLFQIFGQHIYMGCRMPFETTIKVDTTITPAAIEPEVARWKSAYDIAHDQAAANGVLVEDLLTALLTCRPIIEADYESAKEHCDADWEGAAFEVLDSVDKAIARIRTPGDPA